MSSNSRLPQPDAPHPAKKAEQSDGGVNALWRVPKWFPQLSPDVQALLQSYHAELLKFNAKLNLVSRNSEREADEIHFADSIMACEMILADSKVSRVFDLGSGNGFPGLVMAILDPTREMNLVESDVRKCEFLKHIVHTLKLPRVNILNVRLETLVGSKIEMAINRGFASISGTSLACNRILEKGAVVYHLKGNSWAKEIGEMPVQLISFWEPRLVGEYSLPVSQVRHAIVSTHKIQ